MVVATAEEGAERLAALALPLGEFLKGCRREPIQLSGPGGSRRNRVLTGVRVSHPVFPESVGTGGEYREAERNLRAAAHRLRLAAAIALRTGSVEPDRTPPLPERKGGISPDHEEYPLWVALMLDRLAAREGALAPTAADLGRTTSGLLKQLYRDKEVWSSVNRLRGCFGHKPLHPPR